MHGGALFDLIQSYGYGILFILVAVESLGIPLPGETALIIAAAFAATGDLSLPWVLGVTASAAILGDNTAYWIGHSGGLPLLERHGRRFGLTEKKLDRAREFYKRHGQMTVLIGRFIAILRSWAAILAGVMRMSYVRFIIFNALGCIAWTSVYGTLGYLFGENLPLLEHYTRAASIAAGAIVVAGLAVWLIRRRRRSAK